MPSRTLLILTVGGASEPIAASILHHRPARVCFVVSENTKPKIESGILPILEREGLAGFGYGNYDILKLKNPQDYLQTVDDLRVLSLEIVDWLARGDGACVIADITGGTKVMSAALAQTATHVWPGCTLSYVGGTERSSDGVGVVVSGKEQIVHRQNPWEALGYLVVEEARVLFNKCAYPAAIAKLEPFQKDSQLSAARKAEFTAFITLCRLFDEWNRFQHEKARNYFKDIGGRANNMEKILSPTTTSTIYAWLDQHLSGLELLASKDDTVEKREALVLDLIANARRRIAEGAYDDAVARFYRATEAYAQARLMRYGIKDTGSVPRPKIPEEMDDVRQRANYRDNTCKLGLQDAYRLLASINPDDEAGVRFKQLGLDAHESMLSARNKSMLAHGFNPSTKTTAENFLQAVLKLVNLDEAQLIRFPSI